VSIDPAAGHTERVFRILEARGLVTKTSSEEETSYRPTMLFFTLVEKRLNHSMYVEISAALSASTAEQV
jgi:hypothetical protein